MHKYDITEQGAPLDKAKKALILVHGRGASAQDILGLAPYFADESFYIAAPQATNHSWYPASFMVPATQNEPWLSSAIGVLHTLIGKVKEYVPIEGIYLMGFSQGACLSSEITARYAQHYGGVVAFTGGLIGGRPAYNLYKGDLKGVPVYLSNGSHDPHVPQSRSDETRIQFEKMGARVEMDIFPDRPHTVTQQEIDRVKKFIFNSGG